MLRIVLAALLAFSACRAEPPSGVYSCRSDADCPTGWKCERDIRGENLCFSAATGTMSNAASDVETATNSDIAHAGSDGSVGEMSEFGTSDRWSDRADAAGSHASSGTGGLGASHPNTGVAGIDAAAASSGGTAGSAGASHVIAGGGSPTAGDGSGSAAMVQCSSGFKLCPNGECQAVVDDPAHCGSTCELCANGSVCAAGRCVACPASEHVCTGDNSCFLNSDPMHCGTSCAVCEAKPHATALCENNACKWRCDAASLPCSDGASCAQAAWDFEDNTTQGWTADESSATAAEPLRVSTTRVHGGRYALAAAVSVDLANERYSLSFRTKLCTLETLPDLRGKTISAWFYFDGPAVPEEGCCWISPYVFVKTQSGTSSFSPNEKAMVPTDQLVAQRWFRVSGRMPADSEQPVHTFTFQAALGVAGWRGTVYVDDIRVE